MNLPWFRMYSEFLTDPIIRMLSFEDQRHFVAALCLKSSGILDKQYPDPSIRRHVIASLLGLNPEDLSNGKNSLDAANSRLTKLGLVDENWHPINWEKRQFSSDNSTERTRKWREKRSQNVTETSQERSGDCAEQNRTEQNRRGVTKRTRRSPASFQPDVGYAKAQVPDMDVDREVQKFRDWEFKTPRSDWPAVWRTWVGRCRDTGQYTKVGGGKSEWM